METKSSGKAEERQPISREPLHRKWIKLFIKESLIGTMREEMNAEERGIWVDFLLLAGNSRIPGVICANENTPFSLKRISQILNTPEKLINQCIVLFEKSDRIWVDTYDCIHITNWAKYQYSDYDRQKRFREKTEAQKDRDETDIKLKQTFGQDYKQTVYTPEAIKTALASISKEDLEIAIEAFGQPEEWDDHNWVAATGHRPKN